MTVDIIIPIFSIFNEFALVDKGGGGVALLLCLYELNSGLWCRQ